MTRLLFPRIASAGWSGGRTPSGSAGMWTSETRSDELVSERVEASCVLSPGPCCCCSCWCWLIESLPTGCWADARSRRCWSSSFLRSAQARSRGGGLRSHRRWLTTAMDVRGMRDSRRAALTRGSLRACRTTDMAVREDVVYWSGVAVRFAKRERQLKT